MTAETIYKNLRKQLIDEKVTTAETHGEINLSADVLAMIREGIKKGIVSSDIVEANNTVDMQILEAKNQKVNVTLLPLISQDLSGYYISEKAENFYRQFSRIFTIPNELMIYELIVTDEHIINRLKEHLKYAITVRQSLDIIKDYKKELGDCEEFFINSTDSLIIQTFYQFKGESQSEKIAEVLAFIRDDPQKEVYKSFFKIQVVSFLKNFPENVRFQSLIENFQTIYLNFKKAIEFYFRNYDYEKNKNELQSKKIDLAKKIHSVINDISTKIITIPAAYLLILKDLNTQVPFKYLNIIYFFAAMVYALIIQTSFSNQSYLLHTLKKDKDEFIATNLKSPELTSLFGRYKKELEGSIDIQYRILVFLTVVLWALPISIALIIVCYSL